MSWVESVRAQLSDEGVPFGAELTVLPSQLLDGHAVVRLYSAEPLHETVIQLRPGHPNVERAYDDAKRQHERAVANLRGKS